MVSLRQRANTSATTLTEERDQREKLEEKVTWLSSELEKSREQVNALKHSKSVAEQKVQALKADSVKKQEAAALLREELEAALAETDSLRDQVG